MRKFNPQPAFRLASTETAPANMPQPFPWSPRRERDRYSVGHISLRLAFGLRTSAIDAQAHSGEGNYQFTRRLNTLFDTPDTTLWRLRGTVEDIRTPNGRQSAILPPQVHSYNLGINAIIIVQGHEYEDGKRLPAPQSEPLLAEVHCIFTPQDALHGLITCAITSFEGSDLPREAEAQLPWFRPQAPLPRP